jgi:hypothetical protein
MSNNILNEEYDVFDIVEADLDSLDTLEEVPNLEISEEASDSEETLDDSIEESVEETEENAEDIAIYNESNEISEDVNEIEDYLVQRRNARTKSEMEISEQHPNKQETMEEQEISEEAVAVEETEEIVEGSVEQAEEVVAEQTEEVETTEEVEEIEEAAEVVEEIEEGAEVEATEEVEEIEEAKKATKKESDDEEEEESDEDSDDEEEMDSDEEDEEDEEEEEEDVKSEKKVKKEDAIAVETDDIKRLIESEENLTEGFKAKAALIFETEVRSQIAEAKEKIQAEYDEKLTEEVETMSSALSEQVDEYLTYAVSEWAKENSVAIETSLRTSIAEDFMSSLKTLFVENYIEVPETKVDLFEQLESEVAQVKEDFDKTRAIADELADKVDALTREKVIVESCEGLVQTQVEKLKSLAEGVDFEGEDKFRESINTLKGFYFEGAESINEETEEQESDEDSYSTTETIVEESASSDKPKVSKAMQNYLSAISKGKKFSE